MKEQAQYVLYPKTQQKPIYLSQYEYDNWDIERRQRFLRDGGAIHRLAKLGVCVRCGFDNCGCV